MATQQGQKADSFGWKLKLVIQYSCEPFYNAFLLNTVLNLSLAFKEELLVSLCETDIIITTTYSVNKKCVTFYLKKDNGAAVCPHLLCKWGSAHHLSDIVMLNTLANSNLAFNEKCCKKVLNH